MILKGWALICQEEQTLQLTWENQRQDLGFAFSLNFLLIKLSSNRNNFYWLSSHNKMLRSSRLKHWRHYANGHPWMISFKLTSHHFYLLCQLNWLLLSSLDKNWQSIKTWQQNFCLTQISTKFWLKALKVCHLKVFWAFQMVTIPLVQKVTDTAHRFEDTHNSDPLVDKLVWEWSNRNWNKQMCLGSVECNLVAAES